MSIKDFSGCFSELEGLTLEWWSTMLGHNGFFFRGTLAQGRYAQLRFWYTLQIDVVPVMHNCRLRMATIQENERLRKQLTEIQSHFEDFPEEMGYSMEADRIIIECDEGTFSIWAHMLEWSWTDEGDLGVSQEMPSDENPYWQLDAPLWPGGPAFADL